MSVVNKMLRDLENREQPITNSADYVPPKLAFNGWLLVLIVCVIAFVATSYSFYIVNQDQDDPINNETENDYVLQDGEQYAALNQTLSQTLDQNNPPSNSSSNTINNKGLVQPSEQISTGMQAPLNVKGQNVGNSLNLQALTTTKSDNHEQALSTNQAQLSPSNENSTQGTFIKVAPSDGAKTKLSSLRASAHLASKDNDEEEVVRLLQEILRIAPNELRTRKQLAALLFSKEQLDYAQKVLAEGLRLAPSDSSLRLMLARIHFKLGDQTKAFSVLSQHPYEALANDELISFRAALAERIGKYPEAEQDYLVLIKRNPTEAKWWLGLGVSQDKQRLSKKAITSYQQAQSLKQLPQQVDTFVESRIQLLARRS
jgi:MSHA biogenesis protein MshN